MNSTLYALTHLYIVCTLVYSKPYTEEHNCPLTWYSDAIFTFGTVSPDGRFS